MEQSSTQAHVRDLDALRGIAIFGVVMTHVVSSLSLMGMFIPGTNLDLTQFFVTGGLGVQLFFLLSGYLLTTTEGRRYAAGTGNIRGYVRRRFLRLAPAYYLSIVCYLALYLQLGWYHPSVNVGFDLLTYVTFLHGLTFWSGSSINPAYWSLTCEVVFYAALPAILRYAQGIRARLALYLALLALSAGCYFWYAQDPQSDWGWYLIFHPLTHLHLFLAGSLLAMLSARKARGAPLPLPASAGDSLLLLALAGLTLNAYLHAGTDATVVLSRLGGETLVAVGFAAYVVGSPLLRAILALPGLTYLGRISYSIFLFHELIILVAERFGMIDFLRAHGVAGTSHLALFALYLGALLAVSIALASVTYSWVEAPGMRGFRRTRPTAVAPASAA